MHASCESPWHSLAKHCILDTCFLLTVPFRVMLLTPQGGSRCLAPTAHQIPVYLMVFSTFLCRAFTAHYLVTPRLEHLQTLLVASLIVHVLGDVAGLASWRIPCPVFGQGQAEVEQGMVVATDIAHEHADLAVIDLAPVATPLPFDTHGVRTTFGETAGIEGDDAIGFAQPGGHLAD